MTAWITTVATLVTSLLAAMKTWLEWQISNRERQSGKDAERLKQSEAARKVEHEMAKVEANPSTADSVSKRLSDGKF